MSFGLWTVLGFLDVAWKVIDAIRAEVIGSPWEQALWEMSSAYGFALVMPLLIWFASRHRFTRSAWPQTLSVHAPVMVLFSLAHVGIMVSIRYAVYRVFGGEYHFGPLWLQLPYEFLKDIITYWVIVGLTAGWYYYRQSQERALRESELERQLAQARLHAISQQLHPHFLFNTLNTISAIMHENVAAADTMLTKLSDLLRLALDRSDTQEVTLEEESRALALYADIMGERFRDRLTVDVDVDPSASTALVPTLILQPLVENAIRHGVSRLPEGGTIHVQAERRNGRVRVAVADSGPGTTKTPAEIMSGGVGLSSTANRLAQLYGADHQFAAGNAAEGGFRVTIDLPYHTA
jgi:two-component system, LytTR family, sensor kinase